MIIVNNIIEAQATPNAVHIQIDGDQYIVYQQGDDIPQTPVPDNE